MTAEIVRFPPRRLTAIWILPDGRTWLVQACAHAWLFGSRIEARREAVWLSRNLQMPVREVVAATGRA